MTLAQYLHILRKRWLTMVSLTILGVFIAAGITLMMPRVYAASATNFVTLSDGSSQKGSLSQNSQLALANVTSYSSLVNSPSVLQPVIDDLHLKTTPAQLAKDVSATNPAGTVLIIVAAKSTSAHEAQSIANAVSTNLGSTVEKLAKPKGGQSQVSLSVAKRAAIPPAPVSPRPTLNVALGVLVGLFVGACVAVIRDRFDTSIKSPEALQAISGVAPLGAVPFEASIAENPLILLSGHARAVESFRTIRTNLRFVDVDKPPQQVVITSAVGAEGKTVTACNLALALAQGARKVCLVEGDLRRPKACSYLGLNGAIGLTNVVAGQYLLEDVLIPWRHGQITVLPAGTAPPDPSQLLGSHAVHEILARLRERFDFVIIDAPPVFPVSDAAVLSASSDGAVVVVRHGDTHREKVSSAIERLRTAHTHVIGTVLTGVKERRGDSVYDYQNAAKLSDNVADATSLDAAEADARRRRTERASSDASDDVAGGRPDAETSALEDATTASR